MQFRAFGLRSHDYHEHRAAFVPQFGDIGVYDEETKFFRRLGNLDATIEPELFVRWSGPSPEELKGKASLRYVSFVHRPYFVLKLV